MQKSMFQELKAAFITIELINYTETLRMCLTILGIIISMHED